MGSMAVLDVATPTFSVSEPDYRRYVRSPVTAARLGIAVLLVLLMYVPLRGAAKGEFATLFGDLLGGAPRWLISGVVSVCQLGFLVPAVLGLLGQLVQRHFVRVGRLLLASIVCVLALAAMSHWVGGTAFHLFRTGRGRGPDGLGRHAELYGLGPRFPTALDFGVIATWIFMDANQWSPRWRRLGAVVLVLGVAARLGVGLADPAVIIVTIIIAVASAQLVQLLFGVRHTRARARDVGDAMVRMGYDITSVSRQGGVRAFEGFRVERADGGVFYVKIISRESWLTMLPVRLYKAARFREAGEQGPFRSLRSSVEHESLSALKVYSDGVPTPRLEVVTEFRPGAMLMAFDAPRARPLSRVDPQDRPPNLLQSVWSIVATLRRNHSVHHHLNLDSLLVDDEGGVWLIEFGATSLGVTGPGLSVDVAEVLAGTSARLGVERAVRAAVDGVGAQAVAEALPRLQPLALTRPTRAALKASGCLDELREEVQRVTGAEPVPIAQLERITMRSLLTVVISAVALWTLVPQFLGFSAVWAKLGDANWWWVALALVLSALTYVGAAIALDGSITERLPMGPNLGVQVATSFVGVAAPGGSLALTVRFLQQRGIEAAAAAAAVGVDTIAGVVVHLTLLGLFVSFAGTSGLKAFHLPSLGIIGLIALAVVVIGALGFAVPWSRSLVTTHLWPATRRSFSSIGEVARQPFKVVELFGGSLAITLGYVLALEVAVAAFGAGPSFTAVALVYLVGSVVFSVAPTPGGIGAVEATLIAGLTSAGMPSATAVAAVLVFRLATFWLPLLPGWGALAILQRSGDL
jgi:glycosyltransferase 2 family protein